MPIEQVNYALRGVELSAGRSEVVFRYEPASATWGMRLGGLAVGLLVCGSAWGWKNAPA